MKSMLKTLGKTDRCLVGVVLFARLEMSSPERSRSFEAATGTPPAKQRRVSANRA